MVILNFTVPFALEAIPKGWKKRTMRPVRENPNSNWNRLFQKFTFQKNNNLLGKHCYLVGNHPLAQLGNPVHLQLWWQQRSRFFRCEHCGTKILFSQEHKILWEQRKKEECWNQILTINEFKCKQCQGIMWQKEAHKLADAILTNMTKRTLGSLTEEEWKADGFDIQGSTYESSRIMGLLWFANTYKYKIVWDAYNKTYMIPAGLLNFEVYIIEWELV